MRRSAQAHGRARLRLHQMMRSAQQRFLRQHVPVHRAKQRHILTLHMREKRLATERVRTAHRETNQRRADLSVPAKGRMHGEPRAKPHIVVIAMNTHGADHLFRHAGETTERHQLLRVLVDIVAIIADKNALLDAEDRAPQPECLFGFPIQRGPLDTEFARRIRRENNLAIQRLACNRFAEHDHSSYDDSDEHAPHLPQPALISLERMAAALSMPPSGCKTDFMNSGVGAG
jgi:hypothetical protein